jgi:hypothetical protein
LVNAIVYTKRKNSKHTRLSIRRADVVWITRVNEESCIFRENK